eukprot:s255_g5.t3
MVRIPKNGWTIHRCWLPEIISIVTTFRWQCSELCLASNGPVGFHHTAALSTGQSIDSSDSSDRESHCSPLPKALPRPVILPLDMFDFDEIEETAEREGGWKEDATQEVENVHLFETPIVTRHQTAWPSAMVELFQILAGLLGLVGSQGDRSFSDFALDVSKQLLGLLTLQLLGTSQALSELLAEATVGVGFEYLLLRSCSPLIFENIVQNKDLRTGEYSEGEELDPMRYLHQLWIWLLCVCTSQYALTSLQIPSLFAALQFLLAPFDWIDLEGSTTLVLCCICRALQFRLIDVLVLRRGGLAPSQAANLLLWGVCATAQTLLGAVQAMSETFQPPLVEPLLDVEGAGSPGSPGRARAAVERRAKEREAKQAQAKLKAPPTSTAPWLPAPAASTATPVRLDAASQAPAQRRDRSPSPKKPKSGGTWTRDAEGRQTGKVLPVNVQVQSLKGMIAERDSDLKELHENLDELLKDFSGVAGLDALSPLPSFSPTVETGTSPAAGDASGRSSPSFHSDRGFSVGFPGPPATWAPYPSYPSYPSNGWMPDARPVSVWGSVQRSRESLQNAGAGEKTESQQLDRRSSGQLDRRSRRYDVLDKKIDSLLTALGAAPAAPAAPAPRDPVSDTSVTSVESPWAVPHFGASEVPAASIDQRIEVLQNKMDQLFRLRDQHAVPKTKIFLSVHGDSRPTECGAGSQKEKSEKSEGGMFDFDDLEEQKATSTKGVSRRVEVAFQHGGEKWLREYQVGADGTVLDLKTQIGAEVAKIQFCRFGRPLADDEPLKKEDRLEYLGRNLERVRPTKPEVPPTWNGDEEVTIIIDAALELIHSRRVSTGSSVGELKTAMARDDPSGATVPDDFELGITGGSGRPLANDVVLSEIGIRQLELVQG